MPGGGIAPIIATTDVNLVEAPVTFKAYLLCAFACFGGILFGFDSGYINGVTAMPYFIGVINGLNPTDPVLYSGATDAPAIASGTVSLIVSILSAGTFFGAIIAGDLADMLGRRTTIIMGCAIFILGVILQVASYGLGLVVAGRLIAGFGVGFVSAIVILYMSEVAPRKVRGAIVSGYQFCITIGLMLAACVDYATNDRMDSGSYRIPMGIQIAFGLILGTGLFLLPESPRYFVKRGNLTKAAKSLASVRGQPIESEFVQTELAEIVANHEYEMKLIPHSTWFQSWANCFTGSLWDAKSNLRKTILGTSLQMMQQWTGVNFIFYYSSIFLESLGTISNVFLISMVFTIINVCSTPISFWAMEKIGRRPLLIWGAFGMLVCEFIAAIIGTVTVDYTPAAARAPTSAIIAFICFYIFFFATTWGPGAWVVIGEVFPLPIRSRGVALSTASNWLWNCIIAVITPYMVGKTEGNLGPKVLFIWGALCTACFVYAYFLVPETKGLTLEQVDQMLEEVSPRNSAGWRPTETFAAKVGITEKGTLKADVVEDVARSGSMV